MSFNINEISATINKNKGIILASHFICTITPPSHVSSGEGNRIFMELCEGVTLPGARLQAQQIKVWGYGVSESRPIQASQPTVNMTFICDGSAKIIKLFHKWVQLIYNINPNSEKTQVNGMRMYDFEYPGGTGGFEGSMQVVHYNVAADKILTYSFTGAYPIAISDMSLAWKSTEEYSKFQVEMAYIHWHTEGFSNGSAVSATTTDNSHGEAPHKDTNVSHGTSASINTNNSVITV